MRARGLSRAPSASSGTVLTDRRLSLYAAWFESTLRASPGVRSLRLFPEGLEIPGFEPAAAESLLALPERRGEIGERLSGPSRGEGAGATRRPGKNSRRLPGSREDRLGARESGEALRAADQEIVAGGAGKQRPSFYLPDRPAPEAGPAPYRPLGEEAAALAACCRASRLLDISAWIAYSLISSDGKCQFNRRLVQYKRNLWRLASR